jgi:hypothetical protein
MSRRLSSYWQVSLDLGFCVLPSSVDTPGLVRTKPNTRAESHETIRLADVENRWLSYSRELPFESGYIEHGEVSSSDGLCT